MRAVGRPPRGQTVGSARGGPTEATREQKDEEDEERGAFELVEPVREAVREKREQRCEQVRVERL
jgi:hypothetical protein